MKIFALRPDHLPHSSRIYLDNISSRLSGLGHEITCFSGPELPPQADIYWQPSAGRNGPSGIFRNAGSPVVVTFHGAANLALPVSDCYGWGWRQMVRGYRARWETYRSWQRGRQLCSAVIAVSEYAKKEAVRYLRLPEALVTPIHHGVDHKIFYPGNEQDNTGSYLLHISSYQPKKNIERMIAAYRTIDHRSKPRFKIVSPGYRPVENIEGIEFIDRSLDQRAIAELYRGAIGFIFPSLHETFGMPIIESMASGCPVITSNNTACAEIAGEAALLIDPLSVRSIAVCLERLLDDDKLRKALVHKGIERAGTFNWDKSAKEHAAVFKKLMTKTRKSGAMYE